MKKEEKITPRDQMENHRTEKFTQSQLEETSKEKDNIKDYNRAWEDDRL
ncbi:hypothetical protein [Ectobacillus panaciterrae]|nr:hypothetical protein [Ectobacillus panaciterrae]